MIVISKLSTQPMIEHYQVNNTFASMCPQRIRHINYIFKQLKPESSQLAFLLPLLLSVNHPKLPGFINGLNIGSIINYQPTSQALSLIKQFFNVDAQSIELPSKISFIGLYTIGSLGSLGQSAKSDWDVWLCLNDDITFQERQLIQNKCTAIEQWGNQIGAELHIFLVKENQFKDGVASGFDKDSSGSTQHWLLLDEFYRSAITLAGKPIRWNLSSESESIDTLDFGHPNTVPAQEYFSAMMWQLYKGIDSPEKSLLKALLLESYLNDYPNTELLSVSSQKSLQTNEFVDHYYLLFQRISNHLESLKDNKRLSLVRDCFYLKCSPNLSYIKAGNTLNYQQQQLKEITTLWGFSKEHIKHLDKQARWSPVDNQQHHQALVSSLLESYRLMKKMAQHHSVDETVYPQELTVLSRKLYSAYQQSSTKIDRLPPVKSVKHTNNSLYLRRAEHSRNDLKWLLLSHPPRKNKNHLIHQDKKIIKLLTWAIINQLVNATTQIKLPNELAKYNSKINLASKHIATHFTGQQKATKKALVRSSQIEKVSIIINMLDDATVSFKGQTNMMDWLMSNIFSIGRHKHSLVSNIDLIYRNSWNEHHAISFKGNTSILELLSHLFTLIRSTNNTPIINIISISQHHRQLLCDHVEFLINECFIITQKSNKTGIQVKSLVVAGKLYGLFFHPEKVEFKAISNAVDLYKTLSQSALTQLPNKQPTTSKIKRLIYEHASIDHIQFFLESSNKGIQVYILDEYNNLSNYWQDEQNELDLLSEIYRFYTFTKEQKNKSQENLDISFNLPQFNRIKLENSVIIIEPFDQQAEELF